jgi:anti-sigma-K factor RskA
MSDEIPMLSGDEALAADFALGVLDREAMRDAELRMLRDPAFRALVEDWQADLAPLADEIAPLAPSPQVWQRIAAEIDPAPAKAAIAAAPAPSWWSNLAVWRALTFGSASAAALALGLLVARPDPGAAPGTAASPLLVATLASSDGVALITAAYDPGRGAVILSPAGTGGDAQHSPELWVIDGDAPPRSLGVIDLANPQAHVIPAERLRGLKPGVILAVSIEPLGGSKTGLPTGPVVATGKLAQI